MSEAAGWSTAAVLFGMAIVYGETINDTRNSPCVYRHGWVIDQFSGNDQKRTCAVLLKESNSRIEAQQAQIVELTEQAERPIPLPATYAAPDSVSEPARTEDSAPTLSAKVDPTVAHSSDDVDDDDDNN